MLTLPASGRPVLLACIVPLPARKSKTFEASTLSATGFNGNPVVLENNSGNGLSNGGELAESIVPDGVLSDEMSYDADSAFAYNEGRAGLCTATGLRLRSERTQASVTSNAT